MTDRHGFEMVKQAEMLGIMCFYSETNGKPASNLFNNRGNKKHFCRGFSDLNRIALKYHELRRIERNSEI